MRGKILGAMIAYGLAGAMAGPAQAIPKLQVYVEGGTYDSGTESWEVFTTTGGGPVRLWVIGNTAGPGGAGDILDVKLSVAYDAGAAPILTLTPSTTGGFGGFADPSTPMAPEHLQTVTDGSTPVLSDGSHPSNMPKHGIFGPMTDWQEFGLGDFTLTDSPIDDFITSFPTMPVPAGQINVYEVSAGGFPGPTLRLHFDAYGELGGDPVFAPFSHDAEAVVPAPGAVVLAVIGLGMSAYLRRRRPV